VAQYFNQTGLPLQPRALPLGPITAGMVMAGAMPLSMLTIYFKFGIYVSDEPQP
jgi:hypothetical protein